MQVWLNVKKAPNPKYPYVLSITESNSTYECFLSEEKRKELIKKLTEINTDTSLEVLDKIVKSYTQPKETTP